jgi:hypothetical protein
LRAPAFFQHHLAVLVLFVVQIFPCQPIGNIQLAVRECNPTARRFRAPPLRRLGKDHDLPRPGDRKKRGCRFVTGITKDWMQDELIGYAQIASVPETS